jgi:hypothetical protein
MSCDSCTSCECRPAAADPGWLAAHRSLIALHLNKSGTYGTGGDRFANFSAVAEKTGRPPEYYVAERMIEKLTRAVNQMDAGDAAAVKEWPDLAGLALCGEALRARSL